MRPRLDRHEIIQRVQTLSDVELAMLLSLVANQHAIIHIDGEALDALEGEVKLIASNIFGLSYTVLHCSATTTLEDFSKGLLISPPPESREINKIRPGFRRSSSYYPERSLDGEEWQIAEVVIARNLGLSTHQVQMQALELLRTKRIFTRTAVYTAPKTFLFLVLSNASLPPLVNHLNDHIFISHFHSVEDEFPNTEEGSEWVEDDRASLSSVVHRTSFSKKTTREPLFPIYDVASLAELKATVTINVEVKRYLRDVVTFLRLHRAIASGVTPRATKDFELLAKCLALLHGLDFVTPSLVSLAAPKVYSHRLVLVAPEEERSMQYGSDLAAIRTMLDGVDVSEVIEEVLGTVEAPS